MHLSVSAFAKMLLPALLSLCAFITYILCGRLVNIHGTTLQAARVQILLVGADMPGQSHAPECGRLVNTCHSAVDILPTIKPGPLLLQAARVQGREEVLLVGADMPGQSCSPKCSSLCQDSSFSKGQSAHHQM